MIGLIHDVKLNRQKCNKKVLRCKIPLLRFVKNGDVVVKYFESHIEAAFPWSHEIDRACGTCM